MRRTGVHPPMSAFILRAGLSGLALGVLAAACSPADRVPANCRLDTAAGLSYAVPVDWVSSPPNNPMRAAQYALPAAEGEAAPSLVISYFGEGKGGDAADNIERWIGMIRGPDGKPAKAGVRRETRKVRDFTVTMVTADGSYDAFAGMGMAGGMGAHGGAHSEVLEHDYRLWGAVVEGPGGPWFIKATGPRSALQRAESSLKVLVASLRKKA